MQLPVDNILYNCTVTIGVHHINALRVSCDNLDNGTLLIMCDGWENWEICIYVDTHLKCATILYTTL